MIPIKTTGEENHTSHNESNAVGLSVMNHAPTPYRQISICGEISRHGNVPNTTGGNGSHILIYNFKMQYLFLISI